MAPSKQEQPPSNGRRWLSQPVLLAGLAMAAVFAIVLAVSLMIGRQNAQPSETGAATAVPGSAPAEGAAGGGATAAADPQAAAPSTSGDGTGFTATSSAPAPDSTSAVSATPAAPQLNRWLAAVPTPTLAGGLPLVVPAGERVRLDTFRDPAGRFQLLVDQSWRSATTEADGAPLPAADFDVIFADPDTSARMALSHWAIGVDLPLHRAAMNLAPGQAPVNSAGPTNARIAGEPALLLWAPESPVQPAVYTALLEHEDRLYRLMYAAGDGGAGLLDFTRLLVSLEWLAADGSSTATIDTIPPLPQPASRYFPTP